MERPSLRMDGTRVRWFLCILRWKKLGLIALKDFGCGIDISGVLEATSGFRAAEPICYDTVIPPLYKISSLELAAPCM